MNAIDELKSAMYAWCRQVEMPHTPIISKQGAEPVNAAYRTKDISDIKAVYVSRVFYGELAKAAVCEFDTDCIKILGVPVFVIDDSMNGSDHKHQDYFIAGKLGR